MTIELTADKSYNIAHDLNFAQERYDAKHNIVSRNILFFVCPLMLIIRSIPITVFQKPQACLAGRTA